MIEMKNGTDKTDRLMSMEEFAQWGDGIVAYIKPVKAGEMQKLFPQLAELPEEADLFALHGADGTTIALSDSRGAAIVNAREHDLELVSVH